MAGISCLLHKYKLHTVSGSSLAAYPLVRREEGGKDGEHGMDAHLHLFDPDHAQVCASLGSMQDRTQFQYLDNRE